MPSFYLHQQTALMAVDAFVTDDRDRSALALGALGPDVMFFHKLLQSGSMNPLRQAGRSLHQTRTNDFLIALLQFCTESDMLRAYALGFLSHYATDTVFHPFVYAHSFREDSHGSGLARPGEYSSVLHFSLERALDTWLRHSQNGDVKRGTISGLGDLDRNAISRKLALACVSWNAETDVSQGDLTQAIKNASNIISTAGLAGEIPELCATLLSKAWGADSLEPVSDSELAGMSAGGWRNPWQPGVVSYDGPTQLLASSIERTRAYARLALDYWDMRIGESRLRAALGDMSYLSGIDWRHTGEKPGEVL